jgi:hypothetical protein
VLRFVVLLLLVAKYSQHRGRYCGDGRSSRTRWPRGV